jgi:hypothetical protein
MSLPHPLRPAVPSPVDVSPLLDPQLGWALALLAAVALVGWWWLRRQRPVGRDHQHLARSGWRELETAVGAADWYDRFGQKLCALNGYGPADHHRTARLLASLAGAEAGRPWEQVARRWEWAIYAGHPGTAPEHRADLQLARARWP